MPTLEIDTSGVSEPLSGGQSDFLADWTHRHVGLEGGMGSGKSWAGGSKLVTLHLHNAFTRAGDATFTPSAAVAPSYGNAMDFVVPAIRDALELTGLAVRWRGSGPIAGGRYAGPALYMPELGTRSDPSVILIRTADSPDKIAGWQCGAFWADEAARWKEDRNNPKNDPLTQIRGRLRHPLARTLQGMYTYTNEGDGTAIYEFFHSGNPECALYRASTRNNPHVRSFLDDQLRSLTPELAKQYIDGEAISLSGSLAYPQFSDRNVADVELLDGRPLCLALDFNINPGMHGLAGHFIESDDCFVVAHEFHRKRLTTRDLVMTELRNLLAQNADKRFPEVQIFGDPYGSAAKTTDGRTDYDVVRQALAEIGFSPDNIRLRVKRADPGTVNRVNAVNVGLLDMEGNSHVKVSPRCERLIADFRKVRWADDGKGLDKRNSELSHASDALAYWIEYLRPVRVRREMPAARMGFGQ